MCTAQPVTACSFLETCRLGGLSDTFAHAMGAAGGCAGVFHVDAESHRFDAGDASLRLFRL